MTVVSIDIIDYNMIFIKPELEGEVLQIFCYDKFTGGYRECQGNIKGFYWFPASEFQRLEHSGNRWMP